MNLLSKFKKQHKYLQKNEKSKSIRYMYSDVHNSTICNSQDMEATQMPRWLT